MGLSYQRRMNVYQHPDTDGRSELAGKAVQHGIDLAKRIGAKVTVLTVLPPFHTFTADTQMLEDTPVEYKASVRKFAEKTLGAVAHAAGVACAMVQVEHEYPYQAIIDTAVSQGCDLIVMASHGRQGQTHWDARPAASCAMAHNSGSRRIHPSRARRDWETATCYPNNATCRERIDDEQR